MKKSQLRRIALRSNLTPTDVLRSFRSDRRPVALVGRWAGGGAIVASEPLAVADPSDDPLAALSRLPMVEGATKGDVGGGWFGYLGYQLGGLIERLPPPPRRRVALPHFGLAYYDHVLRYECDAKQWWFEALWTPERADALDRRLDLLRTRLRSQPAAGRTYTLGRFTSDPSNDRHRAAVSRCIDHIWAGDIFQANLCLRLEASFSGDPLDLFCACAARLSPSYGAFVRTQESSVASLSPELFLARCGREVTSRPIKGTIRRPSQETETLHRRLLQASAKDRAENVMITDLVRNDLGRVCVPGSIRVPSLARPESHPGVWHLVTTVTGTLREEIDDAALLRATFPPGSVTGAPKIRAMELIAELESSAREVYTGALGYSSPVAGLELNVAIRTFEICDGRIWLGAGGGIVADSDPEGELEECFTKAAPLIEAAASRLAEPAHQLVRA
ncbi:MAG: aminodeoxychorismate synthase component I [Actinomycetota bacterium]|nr:aminodeoxychorismate synthase component I [Actinomycetota bacterium]